MAKLTLNNISNINASPSAETTINANNDAIEAAFENTLSRDGSTPNTMGADLDMNSYRVVNLGTPVNNADAATKKYVDDQTTYAPTTANSGPLLVDHFKEESDPDDTLSFSRALAIRPSVVGTAGKTYILNELAPPSNARIDLGGAIVRPAVGSRFAIGSESARNYVHIFNGFVTDPDNRTLRTTTLTSSASSGATVLDVVSTTGLLVGDVVWVVTSATDEGGKNVLHYSRIQSLTSTTLTLRDAIPAAGAANGAAVMHCKGVVYMDGWTRSRLDVDAFDLPLAFTLTGRNYSGVAGGGHRITIDNADNVRLQVGVVGPDVSTSNYDIQSAYASGATTWRPLCALSFDSRGEVTGTSGDHQIHRCRALNFTNCLIGRRFVLSFVYSAVADNCRGFGFDFDAGSDVFATHLWGAYNQGAISLRGSSRLVCSMLQTSRDAPWVGTNDIEVQDGSVLVLDQSQTTGSPVIRNDAGWSSANVQRYVGPFLAESGAGSGPGLSFRQDPSTGLFSASAGLMGMSVSGTVIAFMAANGFRILNGTATNPAICFNGDQNTGIYTPNLDQFAIAAGGVRAFLTDVNGIWYFSNGLRLIPGTGSPEGVVTAPVGSMFLRSDGGAGTTLYVKQSGTGNTGWVGK